MLGLLRQKTKKYILPVGRLLAKTEIPVMAFTFLAIPLALIAGYFIFQQNYFPAFVFVLLAIVVDFFDGALAEATDSKTVEGNYLDAVTDKIVEAILLVSFVFHFPLETALAFSGNLIISFAKPRAGLVIVTDNRDWPGIGERSERTLLLILALLIASIVPVIFGYPVVSLFLLLFALITWIGGIQRIFYGVSLIKEAKIKGNVLPYLKNSSEKKGEKK